MHGFLAVDKPAGMTSRDAVDRAAAWLPRGTRLGHTGTLDPLATGVLVLAVGAGTRLAEYVQALRKTYVAGIRLGAGSDTDDAEGTVTPVEGCVAPDRSAIALALAGFVGAIEQVPPAFSAAHVDGQRAYDLARKGKEVELAPRKVHIERIELLRYEYPRLDIEVRCSKGTYIRSLARDLGERLGCGGYIESLRRTMVGPFDVTSAVGLDAERAESLGRLQPLETGLTGLPRIILAPADAMGFCQGRKKELTEAPCGIAAVFGQDGMLLGVGEVSGRTLAPVKVIQV